MRIWLKRTICFIAAFVIFLSCSCFHGVSCAVTAMSADYSDGILIKLSDLEKKSEKIEKKILYVRQTEENPKMLQVLLEKRIINTQAQINICAEEVNRLTRSIIEPQGVMGGAVYNNKNAELTLGIVASVGSQINNDGLKEQKKLLGEMKDKLTKLKLSLDAQVKELKDNAALIWSETRETSNINSQTCGIIGILAKASEECLCFNDVDFVWPCPGYNTISSHYGYGIHPITKQEYCHSGTDITGEGISNTPAVAAASGKVLMAGYDDGYGNYVLVYHGKADDGKEYATLYAHMWSSCVNVGDYVKTGDKLGNVGSTGNSTGPHLHFEIIVDCKQIDPISFLK